MIIQYKSKFGSTLDSFTPYHMLLPVLSFAGLIHGEWSISSGAMLVAIAATFTTKTKDTHTQIHTNPSKSICSLYGTSFLLSLLVCAYLLRASSVFFPLVRFLCAQSTIDNFYLYSNCHMNGAIDAPLNSIKTCHLAVFYSECSKCARKKCFHKLNEQIQHSCIVPFILLSIRCIAVSAAIQSTAVQTLPLDLNWNIFAGKMWKFTMPKTTCGNQKFRHKGTERSKASNLFIVHRKQTHFSRSLAFTRAHK